MKILFANIGNRNLKVLGQYDWVDGDGLIEKKFFRQKTQEILENFDDWENKLQINILNKLPLKRFDKIYLIATNQMDTDKNYQDTIFAANIIKKLLSEKGIDQVEIISYPFEPVDRQKAVEYYKELFDKAINFEDEVYLVWSWWVPAMKDSMIWMGLLKKPDIRLLDINEKTWEVKEIDAEKVYLKEIYKSILKEFVKNYDRYGAQKLLEQNPRVFGEEVDFINKLKYINARFNFDFEAANQILDNIRLPLGEQDVFQPIEIQSDLDGIKELLNNIEVTYHKGEYTMLLWKVFRLQEAIYRYIFENYSNVSTDKDKNKGYQEFEKFVSNDEDLLKCVKGKHIEWKPVDYSVVNTRVLEVVLECLEDKLTKRRKELFKIAQKFWALKDMRNLSIMAHGWKGISKEDIDNFQLLDLVLWLKNILWLKENTFDKLNKLLLEEVNNL